MNQRKEEIIKHAIKLFAQQGYHTTSIQEIVDRCGIAKGSFYNHFKSKEELILCIFKFYFSNMVKDVAIIDLNKQLTPKDRYIQQLDVQIKQLIKHRDFFKMLIREQTLNIFNELHAFLQQQRKESFHWHEKKLSEIYPEISKSFIYDCVNIVNGLLKEYVFLAILEERNIDVSRISTFILNRMDSVVCGFHENEKPLLTKELLKDWYSTESVTKEQLLSSMLVWIENNLHIGTEKQTHILITIQNELLKELPEPIVIEGMLLMLRSTNIKSALFDEFLLLLSDYITYDND